LEREKDTTLFPGQAVQGTVKTFDTSTLSKQFMTSTEKECVCKYVSSACKKAQKGENAYGVCVCLRIAKETDI
jgi:hypothetical protein